MTQMNDFPSIETLLPHRESMLLLDRVVAIEPNSLTAGLTLHSASPFFENSAGIPGWVGIEYMAQAISAYAGSVACERGDPIRIGLLLGTQSYTVNCAHFPCDEELHISATSLWDDDDGIGAFSCKINIASSGELLAQAQIKAYQPDNIEAYLESQGDSNQT